MREINTYFAEVLTVARFIPSPGAETLVELSGGWPVDGVEETGGEEDK